MGRFIPSPYMDIRGLILGHWHSVIPGRDTAGSVGTDINYFRPCGQSTLQTAPLVDWPPLQPQFYLSPWGALPVPCVLSPGVPRGSPVSSRPGGPAPLHPAPPGPVVAPDGSTNRDPELRGAGPTPPGLPALRGRQRGSGASPTVSISHPAPKTLELYPNPDPGQNQPKCVQHRFRYPPHRQPLAV